MAGLAFASVCVPLVAVLASGWVMFHMGADLKVLAVAAGSATAAVGAGLLLARWISQSLSRVSDASALRLLQPEAAARNVALSARVEGETTVPVAPEKIERVLYNLLTNALRH